MPADLRAAFWLVALVRLPWLFLTGATAGLFPPGNGARGMPPVEGPSWATVWLRWDSGWYVRVIREGLTASHCGEPGGACQQATIAFLPAYPLSVRGLMELALPLSLASWLLNLACLTLALWGLRRLAAITLGPEKASRAAWAMLAFPTTLFFSAGYAEAMFAAASIWAMVFVARENPVGAAVALSVGALSRPHGIVLAGCVVLVALVQRRIRFGLIAGAGVGLSFGAYLLWQYVRFGDALAFLHARRAWGMSGSSIDTLTSYVKRIWAGEIWALTGLQDFAAAALLSLAAIWSLRRLGAQYALYCLLLLAVPLAQGQIWGMNRAALGAFPIFLMLASVGPRLRRPLAFFGISLATINALLFVNGAFVS